MNLFVLFVVIYVYCSKTYVDYSLTIKNNNKYVLYPKYYVLAQNTIFVPICFLWTIKNRYVIYSYKTYVDYSL